MSADRRFLVYLGDRWATQEMNAQKEDLATRDQSRQRKIKLMLFLVSFACSGVVFIIFDYSYTAAIHRTAGTLKTCGVLDPVRNHAFKPNCASVDRWGHDSYELFTNSLGFRDERIR